MDQAHRASKVDGAATTAGLPWLWDVALDRDLFLEILNGRAERNGLDWKWALARLIEYAPYRDLRQLLPERLFLDHWPEIAARVRSPMRREGAEYLRDYLRRRAAGVG